MFLLAAATAWQNVAADVAQIGAQTYPTLPAAVAAAQSNDTIVLIGDAILTNVLAIAKPLSIVGDGTARTITRTNGFADDLIYVQPAGALVLGDASGNDAAPGLILDGGATNGVAGGYSFIFAVSADVVVHPGVVLRNFRGQYAPLYMLDNDGLATLTLNGGLFAGNTATNSSGGAICSQGADIHARNATFRSNAAPRGRGGAIYMEYVSLVASNLIVQGNSADDYGGGLMALPGEIDLEGGVVSGNSALNGGGIANGYGHLTLDGTRLTNNRAFYGGAVWSHTGTNLLRSAAFRDNQATNYGAALYSTSSRFSISNCEIVANTAGSNGGGLYVSPATTPPSSIAIASSIVSSNSGLYGGAIYSSYSDLSIAGSILSHNRAAGAGGALWLFGDTSIQDSLLSQNAATNEGGGIFHLGGPLVLSGHTRLEDNRGEPGPGIWCYNAWYEGFDAVLSLSGGTSLSADDAIALLNTTNTILLAGTLLEPGHVATIVPAIYSNGLPLLRDGAGLPFSPVSRYYAKFAVAPQPASSTNWHVDANGDLSAAAPPAPPVPPPGLREIASFGAATPETGSFRLDVDPLLLEYDFSLQAADVVTNQAWNFRTLSNGYAVSSNGSIVLAAPATSRVYRLAFP